MQAEFTCFYCYETNATWVDLGGGSLQRYVEDCQVCCRPNVLHATWDEHLNTYTLETDGEG